eukprot:Skav216105  [mRNA]  locus=scaffold2419:6843:7211:- [translate_table: standard]
MAMLEIEQKPRDVAIEMMKGVPKSKLSTITTSTLSSSTRVSARCQFVAEQSMADILVQIETQSFNLKTASDLLSHIVQLAIMTQYMDGKGEISWQKMMGDIVQLIAKPDEPTVEDVSRCRPM